MNEIHVHMYMYMLSKLHVLWIGKFSAAEISLVNFPRSNGKEVDGGRGVRLGKRRGEGRGIQCK